MNDYTCMPGNIIAWSESIRLVVILAYLTSLSLFNAGLADHPKSDEYLSDPRLAAYAVPHNIVVSRYAVNCVH